MTQVWRTLVLLYPVLDARYGSGEQRGRARRVMKRDERAAVTAVVETLPGMVAAWSDGLASLEPFDVVEVRRSIRSLSSSGGGRWWVGPREVRPELESIAEVGAAYDSVYALWPGDPSVPQCGWGCSIGPSEATFNAGFSSISTDHWATLLTDPDPAQGYVHEWLHQVEAVYRALGASEAELPTLHDAAAFTSTRPVDEAPFGRSYAEYHDGGARTWAPWYRDWMTGRLAQIDPTTTADDTATDGTADAGATAIRLASASPIGLTADRWALRKSPGNPVSSD
ncbi:MAG: hypothetical protein H0W22_08965 [Chloroflexi bacterium]|nr:hypothetical protein [Chloroflexota bacterium]